MAITVHQIMTNQVLTIHVEDSLDKAERLMNKNKVRHAPVVKDEKLVGMLSLTDLQRLSFADTYGEEEDDIDSAIMGMLNIEQIMNARPRFIQSDQPVSEAAQVFVKENFHALPVVDGQNKLVGIVTTTDVIRYYLEGEGK